MPVRADGPKDVPQDPFVTRLLAGLRLVPNPCPRCGYQMVGGAPHGDWPVQYECRGCGNIVVPPAR